VFPSFLRHHINNIQMFNVQCSMFNVPLLSLNFLKTKEKKKKKKKQTNPIKKKKTKSTDQSTVDINNNKQPNKTNHFIIHHSSSIIHHPSFIIHHPTRLKIDFFCRDHHHITHQLFIHSLQQQQGHHHSLISSVIPHLIITHHKRHSRSVNFW